jgi:hypothetical protein
MKKVQFHIDSQSLGAVSCLSPEDIVSQGNAPTAGCSHRWRRGERTHPATERAPAAITAAQLDRPMPPMATTSFSVMARAARTPSRPTTGSGTSLDDVAKTGPMAT